MTPRSSTPARPKAPKASSGGKILRLVLAPFFFVFRTVFTFALLSVIGFLVFYFKMHGTPEKEQQYEKIMEAMEQVPSVLGGLAQQAGMGDLAKRLGYEPKPEDAEHSKALLKNLCAQLDAVDEAEHLPWKKGDPTPEAEAPREDEAPAVAPTSITPQAAAPAPVTPEAEPAQPEAPADIAAEPVVQAVPVPQTLVDEAEPALPPEAVPAELEPIIVALKNAKNLSTIKERLSVKFVGQHGAGAVLFLDKLLEKDKGLLRLAALECLRRINTPDALEVLHKHTRTMLPAVAAPESTEVPAAPEVPAEAAAPSVPPAAPVAAPVPVAPAPQPTQEPVQW